MDWEIDGHHLGYIPLDLYGNHSPMAHHCMLKEAHTISYIQQANHEWIEGKSWTRSRTRMGYLILGCVLEKLSTLLADFFTF
jgi:hypothetical protein